jgi:hypothetical protein
MADLTMQAIQHSKSSEKGSPRAASCNSEAPAPHRASVDRGECHIESSHEEDAHRAQRLVVSPRQRCQHRTAFAQQAEAGGACGLAAGYRCRKERKEERGVRLCSQPPFSLYIAARSSRAGSVFHIQRKIPSARKAGKHSCQLTLRFGGLGVCTEGADH